MDFVVKARSEAKCLRFLRLLYEGVKKCKSLIERYK